jgi:hypothetical protein
VLFWYYTKKNPSGEIFSKTELKSVEMNHILSFVSGGLDQQGAIMFRVWKKIMKKKNSYFFYSYHSKCNNN